MYAEFIKNALFVLPAIKQLYINILFDKAKVNFHSPSLHVYNAPGIQCLKIKTYILFEDAAYFFPCFVYFSNFDVSSRSKILIRFPYGLVE